MYINSDMPSIRDQENLCILQAVGFNQLFFKYFSVIWLYMYLFGCNIWAVNTYNIHCGKMETMSSVLYRISLALSQQWSPLVCLGHL